MLINAVLELAKFYLVLLINLNWGLIIGACGLQVSLFKVIRIIYHSL